MAMTLEQLVARVRETAGANLVGVVLYGSAAGRDYHDKASDVNVLILVRTAAAGDLSEIAPVVRAWVGVGNPAPLLLTEVEWRRRSDVFAIEYADLLERHKVLWGTLPVDGLEVKRRDIRHQVESEAVGKLLRLRRGTMSAAGDPHRLRAIVEDSFSSILALIRATLHLHGESAPPSSEAMCDRVGAIAKFDPAPFRTVLAARHGGKRLRDDDLEALVQGYVEALERLIAHIDGVVIDEASTLSFAKPEVS
jgi:predicted nucleotidyltransferase